MLRNSGRWIDIVEGVQGMDVTSVLGRANQGLSSLSEEFTEQNLKQRKIENDDFIFYCLFFFF